MKKSFALGLIIGALLMASTSAFASIGQKIEAYFGEYIITVNGEVADLEDSKIIVKDGTTYLPVRKISNLLGYDVTYLAESRTIELNSSSAEESEAAASSTIHNNDISKGSAQLSNGYVRGRALVEFMSSKYPNLSQSIELTLEGTLNFNGNSYLLGSSKLEDGSTEYNAQVLVDQGILTIYTPTKLLIYKLALILPS